MPQPWPQTSADHAMRTGAFAAGAVRKCPSTGALRVRALARSSNCTR